MPSNETQGPRPEPADEARGPAAEPRGSGREPGAEPDGLDDALHRLEARLERASEAAERLLADAAPRLTGKPPPAGWQRPAADPGAGRSDGGSVLGSDAELLFGILASVRDRIPPELQQRLGEALREVLLALRALIDWYLERTERRRAQPSEVQDIPIL
jgi:hypothetical protein